MPGPFDYDVLLSGSLREVAHGDIMDDKVLEILEYKGEGYKPLIDYGEWRVAVLRYIDELIPDQVSFMERHVETDEVFVLLDGQGVLFLGGTGPQLGAVMSQVMVSGKMYNVKQNAWHCIVLSRDATVLLVENRNTSKLNTEYQPLQPDQRKLIVETSRREQPDWWK